MRKKLKRMIDSKTGQPLFTPQLIKNDNVEEVIQFARKNQINKEGGIGNYLYKQHFEKESKLSAIQDM